MKSQYLDFLQFLLAVWAHRWTLRKLRGANRKLPVELFYPAQKHELLVLRLSVELSEAFYTQDFNS